MVAGLDAKTPCLCPALSCERSLTCMLLRCPRSCVCTHSPLGCKRRLLCTPGSSAPCQRAGRAGPAAPRHSQARTLQPRSGLWTWWRPTRALSLQRARSRASLPHGPHLQWHSWQVSWAWVRLPAPHAMRQRAKRAQRSCRPSTQPRHQAPRLPLTSRHQAPRLPLTSRQQALRLPMTSPGVRVQGQDLRLRVRGCARSLSPAAWLPPTAPAAAQVGLPQGGTW